MIYKWKDEFICGLFVEMREEGEFFDKDVMF